MKLGAITFSFLLATGVVGAIAFTGCSSDPENPALPPADTGVADAEAAVLPDTRPPPMETGPISCQESLPTDFKCAPPPDKAGKTVCTDEAIRAFMTDCFGDTATQAKCSAVRTKYKACDTCFLTDWMYGDFGFFFDTGACIKKIDPTSTCAQTIACNIDCIAAVCSECDNTEGTGKNGAASTDSEQDDCVSDVQWRGSTKRPKGVCYDLATKDYSACRMDTRFAPCFAQTLEEVTQFVRGACRDGGDWSKAGEELPVADAGTDTGTDTGSDTGAADTGAVDTGAADTGAADTGVADSGSDAATD